MLGSENSLPNGSSLFVITSGFTPKTNRRVEYPILAHLAIRPLPVLCVISLLCVVFYTRSLPE
jgi:hypothetical protein